jgi:uncharacterized protein with GYD domain
MPKFLSIAKYTPEGVRGILKEGGTGRRAAIEQAINGLGGCLESLHFGFGEHDAYVITDAPDYISAAALSLAVGASGLASVTTVVLLSPEEINEATKRTVNYRPPGR